MISINFLSKTIRNKFQVHHTERDTQTVKPITIDHQKNVIVNFEIHRVKWPVPTFTGAQAIPAKKLN